MPSTPTKQLPDVARILGPLLERVPREQRPLLIAIAERMAADRYREDPRGYDRLTWLLPFYNRFERVSKVDGSVSTRTTIPRPVFTQVMVRR